jgi:hypothetical protein
MPHRTKSHRLRDGLFFGVISGSKLPGYAQKVPPGQKPLFRRDPYFRFSQPDPSLRKSKTLSPACALTFAPLRLCVRLFFWTIVRSWRAFRRFIPADSRLENEQSNRQGNSKSLGLRG